MYVFLTFRAGFYARQAFIQGRLMCSSCGIISSIHSAEHACRNSTSVCSVHDFPYNKLNKKSLCKPRLLFESGLCVGMQLQKCGFYSRAASIQGWLLYKTLRYFCSQRFLTMCTLRIIMLSNMDTLFKGMCYMQYILFLHASL